MRLHGGCPDDYAERVLRRWAARQRKASYVMLGATLALIVILLAAPKGAGEHIEAYRQLGLVMAGAHGVTHILVLQTLLALCRHRIGGAAEALSAYRDPKQVSHVDLSVVWGGFYLVLPWLA